MDATTTLQEAPLDTTGQNVAQATGPRNLSLRLCLDYFDQFATLPEDDALLLERYEAVGMARAGALRATSEEPDNPLAWYMLAVSSFYFNQLQELTAPAYYQEAVKAAQRSEELGCSDDCKEFLDKILASVALLHAEQAKGLHRKGDTLAAVRECQRAAELAPDEPLYPTMSGWLLVAYGSGMRRRLWNSGRITTEWYTASSYIRLGKRMLEGVCARFPDYQAAREALAEASRKP